MAIRFDDPNRTATLSVLDLVDGGGWTGHLTLESARSRTARMAAGRRVHEQWQHHRAAEEDGFRAEVRLRHQVAIGDWTAVIHGRVDGLTELGGRSVVEEVKSTALDAVRLYQTELADWDQYAAQVQIYLWMLARAGHEPVGRLVLVSLFDGSRHVLGVPLDLDQVERWVRERLEWIVTGRQRRLDWLEHRRARRIPPPFASWRPGQGHIAEVVAASLSEGRPVLVEAPTGLGKTGAVLHGALQVTHARDLQLFWATSRTTQQVGMERSLARFAGLGLRTVTLNAKDKVCLNEVVDCRPEACPFAVDYHDRVREGGLVQALHATGHAGPGVIRATAQAHRVCPFQLALDLCDEADVVIGDYNYVFDPNVSLRRHFGEAAPGWVVVVDEAHQLVERARAYRSPQVEATLPRRAAHLLASSSRFGAFAELSEAVVQHIVEASAQTLTPPRNGLAVAELSLRPWRDLAERIDELAVDYAVLRADHPVVEAGEEDPWLSTSWAVLRFAVQLEEAGDETVHLVGLEPGDERVKLLCRDPSPWLGPHIGRLGGFVAVSATLSPEGFYRDLLGLELEGYDVVRVPSPFPPDRRRVVVAPRVSTAFKDRNAHAPRTAELMARCIEEIPGNAAAYFPSFAMLRDITRRWSLSGRELLVQEPSMSESLRRQWLERLEDGGAPVVLGAVLGGIFAEGIDLPAGALSGVLVAGPALPPVGLERDLLREYYEDRYGEGFRYASLVPGMTRVVQAAGRLIRRAEDVGVVVLVGRRFRWRDHAALLPEDWAVEIPEDPVEAIRGFWEGAR